MAAIVAVFPAGDVDLAWVINLWIEQFNTRGETATLFERWFVGHHFGDEITPPTSRQG